MDRRESQLWEARLTLSKMELQETSQKKEMAILLGLPQGRVWALQDCPLSLPEIEPQIEDLEALAMEKRLDLEQTRWELKHLDRMVGLTGWWTHINEGAGVSMENDAEGSFVIGPTLSGTFPLFNYGQADRARLQALHRQKLAALHALKIRITQEVAAAKEEVQITRRIVETYQEKLLPLHQKIISMSQRFYNGMALGVYQLLDAKKQELALQIEHISALKDYKLSHVALERAVGGQMEQKT
jgi:cobalt-zinc-cadmium efflux system outer membrane protein